jgi:STE24 endopeptidase
VETIFSIAEQANVDAYHRPRYLYAAVMLALGPVMTVLLARFVPRRLYSLSGRWATASRTVLPRFFQSFADRVWRGPGWLETLIFALVLTGLYTALSLPAVIYFHFLHEHQFGLARNSFALFAWDLTKGTTIAALSMAALSIGLLGLARRLRHWWLVLGLASAVALAASTSLDPYRSRVYFDHAPLPSGPLRADISALLEKAGIDFRDVLVEKVSDHTRKVQAYFAGQGSTRTIILTDTILATMNDAELLAVVAHEAAHVNESRWLGTVGSGLAVLALLGLAEVLFRAAARRNWYGVTERGDIRVLPLLLSVFSLILTAFGPFSAAYSRHREYEADAFGVRLTQNPSAFRSMLVKATRANMMDPAPPRWYVLSGTSHPPMRDRIEAVGRLKLQ